MPAILFGSISTLADTSELQRSAFNQAFAEHGLDWNWGREDYRALLTGNGGRDRVADYAQDKGEQVDADAVHATKSKNFQQSLAGAGVQARDGALATIEAARAAGWKVALVTTTSPDNISALTQALDLAPGTFDVIVDTTDVEQSKPDPASYEFALEALGEQASDCVAIEDNVGGVRAAAAAGVPVVAFANENTAGHDFGDTRRVQSLDFDDLRGVGAGV